MTCTLIDQIRIAGAQLGCSEPGVAATVAGIAGLIAALIALAWVALIARKTSHRTGGALVALAALILTLAAGAPVATPIPPPSLGGRIAVLLDLSESARRSGESEYDSARAVLAQQLEASLDSRDISKWEGKVLGFANGTSTLSKAVSAEALPTVLQIAAAGRPADASDLAGGISVALDWIAEESGAGEIFLLTDGWFTTERPDAEIARAAGRGIPINVLALGPDHASQGLIAWNLGPEQAVGQQATGRLVASGTGRILWSVDGRQGISVETAGNGGPQPIRLPLLFDRRGFSNLAGQFEADGQPGRSFTAFTLVRGPARLLVYGNSSWASALPPNRYSVTHARPNDSVALSDFDVVAIDALVPSDFATDFDDRMLSAAAGGTGILLINGGLRGSAEDPQRISDWERSALGSVLPVDSDPAYVLTKHPPRELLIIIDTSSSMNVVNSLGESQAARALQSANRILDFLRPGDRLTILPFSSGVGSPFRSQSVDSTEIARARSYLASMPFGGGTNMRAAVEAAAALRGNKCDLFVIGDGGYEAGMVSTSPICRTTAIGLAGIELPGFDTSWGEQKPLDPGERLGEITFETFEPEKRKEFWRTGPLSALSVEPTERYDIGGQIGGIALSYARPESQVLLVSGTAPRDPVLVFREDPKNRVLKTAVFLGDFPPRLSGEISARILDRLTGWSQPDRFDIHLSLDASRLSAEVATVEGWPLPQQLSLSLWLADGRTIGLDMWPGNETGTFAGSTTVNLGNEASHGVLMLNTGDAPTQAVPIRLPDRKAQKGTSGAVQEADSFGVNTNLLSRMIAATNGRDLSLQMPLGTTLALPQETTPLWPVLATLSLACLAGGLWFGGARR